jgi:rod shape determining protein RodA
MNRPTGVLQVATEKRQPLGFSIGAYLRSMDWILLAATLGLVVFGFFMLYSATQPSPGYYIKSQATGLVLGLFFLIGLSIVNYQWFARWQLYIYGGSILMLIATLVVGSGNATVGANRWLEFGFFRLQTAELVKFLLIISLGAVLAEGIELRHRFRFVLLCIGYILVPGILIFLQPDLGTSLVFVAILLVMLTVWGIRMGHLATLIGAGIFGAVLVLRIIPSLTGKQLLAEFQLRRLEVFLNPEKYPKDFGYQLIQSKIAIGSGMFTGKGYMAGTQHNLNFLPERHTDFIFAVIGEELGFVGGAILIGLFGLVVWRAFRIARMSRDIYGTLIAAGVAGVLVFQVFVNIGMTTGIMPVTGLPLPFVSFGSSSLVVFLMAIGLLESIHVHSVAGANK